MYTYLEPFVQNVLHSQQPLLPGLDPCLKRLDERRASHCLRLYNLIVQCRLYVVHSCQNGHSCGVYDNFNFFFFFFFMAEVLLRFAVLRMYDSTTSLRFYYFLQISFGHHIA